MSIADGIVDDQMLDELDALVANATGGAGATWYHDAKNHPGFASLSRDASVIPFLESNWTIRVSAIADLELVVALRNNVRRLTATIRALRDLREEARTYVGSGGSRLRSAIDRTERHR